MRQRIPGWIMRIVKINKRHDVNVHGWNVSSTKKRIVNTRLVLLFPPFFNAAPQDVDATTRIRDFQLEHLINTSKFPQVERRTIHSTAKARTKCLRRSFKKEKHTHTHTHTHTHIHTYTKLEERIAKLIYSWS